MRQLVNHQTNDCNKQIEVRAHKPSTGGASVQYDIFGPSKARGNVGMVPSFGLNMKFQDGPIADGINGLTNEVLLAILIDRLEGFQTGPYKCDENEQAIVHLLNAKHSLQFRTNKRVDRGVEGTHAV